MHLGRALFRTLLVWGACLLIALSGLWACDAAPAVKPRAGKASWLKELVSSVYDYRTYSIKPGEWLMVGGPDKGRPVYLHLRWDPEKRRLVVQDWGALTEEENSWLEKRVEEGLIVLETLPENAFVLHKSIIGQGPFSGPDAWSAKFLFQQTMAVYAGSYKRHSPVVAPPVNAIDDGEEEVRLKDEEKDEYLLGGASQKDDDEKAEPDAGQDAPSSSPASRPAAASPGMLASFLRSGNAGARSLSTGEPASQGLLVESGTKTYIEQNASGEITSVLTNATYSSNSWKGTPADVSAAHSMTIAGGAGLYISCGGANDNAKTFSGDIAVAGGTAEAPAVLSAGTVNWGNWSYKGALTGAGVLQIEAHSAKRPQKDYATTFRFTDYASPDWFEGTLRMANSRGASVQLTIGNDLPAGMTQDARWAHVVMDLDTNHASEAVFDNDTGYFYPRNVVLALEGDAVIAGLTGTDASGNSRVVTDGAATQSSPYTLTLGDETGNTYAFAGTVGKGQYLGGGGEVRDTVSCSLNLIKEGANTQVIGNVLLWDAHVRKGTLSVTGILECETVTVYGGGALETGSTVNVSSLHLYSDARVVLKDADLINSFAYIDIVHETAEAPQSVKIGLAEDAGKTLVWKEGVILDVSHVEGSVLMGEAGRVPIFELDAGLGLELDKRMNVRIGETLSDSMLLVLAHLGEGGSLTLADGVLSADDIVVRYWQGDPVKGTVTSYLGFVRFDEATNNIVLEHDTSRLLYRWGGTPDANVWQVGDAANSPWGEQGGGVYVDGSAVDFMDRDLRGNETSSYDVDIRGTVRPGDIYVDSSKVYGVNGWQKFYAYAIDSSDETGCIADAVTSPTRLVKDGPSTLVVGLSNTFSGGTALIGGSIYVAAHKALGSGAIDMRDGTALYINYDFEREIDSLYRNPYLENDITIVGNNPVAQVTIGYAPFLYYDNGLDTERASRHWRNLTLHGKLSGTGTINLLGYTSRISNNTLYISSFTINDKNSGTSDFTGTVRLLNQVNHSTLANDKLNVRRTGAVQLNLSDTTLKGAIVDLTRDTGTVGNESRQTHSNILLIQGDTTIQGLKGKLLGMTQDSVVSGGRYEQADEIDLMRVVTDRAATLTLEDARPNMEHYFSGTVGGTGVYSNNTPGYYVLGQETTAPRGLQSLSLVKKGESSAQYIHTATLENLDVVEGVLGFNNLKVLGNVRLTGGSQLELGVTATQSGRDIWSASGTADDRIAIQSGKTLSVLINKKEPLLGWGGEETPARVSIVGNVSMEAGSTLSFVIDSSNYADSQILPSLKPDYALLNVTGSLEFVDNNDIDISFIGVNFQTVLQNNDKYYLASADAIRTYDSSTAETEFTTRMISLGYGYFGIVTVEKGTGTFAGAHDYLVMTVTGDPRRIWSGYNGTRYDSSEVLNSNIWKGGAYSVDVQDAGDRQWKENLYYFDGCHVLFGNLYEPYSTLSATVVTDVLDAGFKESVTIDGVVRENFQKVLIEGIVKPGSITVNADYQQAVYENGQVVLDKEGKPVTVVLVDDTDYVFGDGGNGCIADFQTDSNDLQEFYPGVDLTQWKTILTKSGAGTLVIRTANAYSGGTVLDGGEIVMQNKDALGVGAVTVSRGATLRGDFADKDAGGSELASTTLVNEIHVLNQSAGVTVGGLESNRGNLNTGVAYDAAVANAHDKKLVIERISGANNAVLLLAGVSNAFDAQDHPIAVFEIADASRFSGAIVMDGRQYGTANAPGSVQLNVTSATGWEKATIDLSLNLSRHTILLLAPREGNTVTLDSLTGASSLKPLAQASSHVVNETGQTTNLVLQVEHDAAYFGNLGFGSYQNDSGERVKTDGLIHLVKKGNAAQTVGHARLGRVEVGSADADGGTFHVTSSLIADSLATYHGKDHLVIGESFDAAYQSIHSLFVTNDGILAMDGGGLATDVWGGLYGGMAETDGSSRRIAFVELGEGGTLAAHGDWMTNKDITLSGAACVNAHHYEADPSNINAKDADKSHTIHLLGAITGSGSLTFENVVRSQNRADVGDPGKQQGIIGVRDLNTFDGTVRVADMTTLRVMGSYNAAEYDKHFVSISVAGNRAELQVAGDGVTAWFDEVTLSATGGSMVAGGESVTIQSDGAADGLFVSGFVSGSGETALAGLGTGDRAYARVEHVTIEVKALNAFQYVEIANSLVKMSKACALTLDSVTLERSSCVQGIATAAPASEAAQIVELAALPVPVSSAEKVLSTGETMVHMQLSSPAAVTSPTANGKPLLCLSTTGSFRNVDVAGTSLKVAVQWSDLVAAWQTGARYLAIQISGDGRFDFEDVNGNFADGVTLTLTDDVGHTYKDIYFASSGAVLGNLSSLVGGEVTVPSGLLYVDLSKVPEPSGAALSLLGAACLLLRRRRG